MEEEQQFLLSIGSIVRDPGGDTYVVEALLGQGGFGAVYLVRERHNTHQVFALKEEISANRYRRASFSVEADILRRLDHPALPRVYRVFEDVQRQRSYMLMEYIAGLNLDALRRLQPEQRFPLRQMFDLLAPIVDALNYLHQQNPPIVHRDIKPANIIVPTTHTAAMLVDFGLAKEYVEERTTNAVRPATPGYAAPEQYSGGTGPRTDIYSLGATCYAMLTGQVPPHALRRAISKETDLLEPANALVPTLPEGVARTIARAMSIHSEDRYETVEQFWLELRGAASERPGLPEGKQAAKTILLLSEPDLPQPRRRFSQAWGTAWRERRSVVLAVLALLLLLLGAGGTSALVLNAQRPGASSIAQHQTPTLTAPPGVCGEPSATPAVSQPALGSSSYPRLAPSYAGTIYDNLTTQRTALCLLNIQQQQEKIQGTLQGLGLVGTFQGMVTSDNQIFFTMPLYSGTEKLVCSGFIKVAGDITGTFQIFDQQGNTTGESGVWNASVYP